MSREARMTAFPIGAVIEAPFEPIRPSVAKPVATHAQSEVIAALAPVRGEIR